MSSDAHRPRKRFGQHFLRERGVLDRIVAAVAPAPGQRLLEIGPGEGALTFPLLAAGAQVTVIELDRDLAARLRAHARPDLTVVEADVLHVDLAALAPAPIRLVGNLPYNVSSPILFHCLACAESIGDMHFMLQKEVVERMGADPGSKVYGRLSVMLQARCRVVPLFEVPPSAFHPPPKVDSAVVRLIPRPLADVGIDNDAVFATVVKAAFAQRRKTLRNALAGIADGDTLDAAGLDPGQRAEQVPVEAFITLANRIAAHRQRTVTGTTP